MAGTLPQLDEYGVEVAANDRRRRLAEMMGQGAMEPIQTQTAGGMAVPVSPMQALAKVMQGYMAGKGVQQADSRQKALAEMLRGERASVMERATAAARGTPDQWAGSNAPGDAPVMTPGTPGSAANAYAVMMASRDPMQAAAGQAAWLKTLENQKLRPNEIIKSPDGRVIMDNPVIEHRPLETTGPDGSPVTTFFNPRQPPSAPLPRPVTPQQVTTAGLTGAPQTEFVNPFQQRGPLQQPVKLNMVNTGATQQPVNPYTQQGPIQNTLSPFQAAELPIMRQNAATAAGQLNNAQANTYFNTGMLPAGGGLPGGAALNGLPQMAPQAAPRAAGAPQGQVGAPAQPQGRTGQYAAATQPPARQAVTPKVEAEREADRPQATQALQSLDQFSRGVLADIDYLLDFKDDGKADPAGAKGVAGLSGITGPVMGRLPSVRGDSTNAQTRLDALKGKLSIQELQRMRDASKTGGAVGQVTEKEWPRLENAMTALGQAATTDEFLRRLKEARAVVKDIQKNAGTAFRMTYGRRAGEGRPAGISEAEWNAMSPEDRALFSQ
jgi:hypothetical protein